MKEITEQMLSKMTEAIIREIQPEQIYLFGSRARGDAKPDSDIDLLIVERDSFGPEHSRWEQLNRVRHALTPFLIATDILVYSTDEVAKWQHSINHIIAHCLREGQLLYERS